MNKPTQLPTSSESKKHYTTPEGYFEGLQERLLSQIPTEQLPEATPAPTLWVRLRPIVYMAAMFVGMNFLFRAFYPAETKTQTNAVAASALPEEEYDDYYAEYGERMLAGQAYSSYFQDLAGEPQAAFTSYE